MLILTTRLVVSDKALALWLCRKSISTKRESSETSSVYQEKKSTVSEDRHTGGLREVVVPSWWLESLLWGITSGFPLADHFHLPGSESIFGITQNPPVCTNMSLSQDGFYQRSQWVGRLSISSLLTYKKLSSQEGFLDCGKEKYMVSYLLSGQPPLLVVLLFLS